MANITMRRGGCHDTPPLLELSLDSGPLPKELCEPLREMLTYVHITQLRGIDAICPVTGEYRPARSDVQQLYCFDKAGRLVCYEGWRHRLEREIQARGYGVEFVDLGPPHPRANRFDTDWERIFEKMNVLDKQIEWLSTMESRPFGLIEVPAGAGKTYTIAAYCLGHPHARIWIVTEGIDILKRIYGHMVKYMGSVGMIGGGKNFWGRVTCISADSLHRAAEGFDDPTSKRSPDIILFDEVHRAAAKETLTQLTRTKNCRRYGFSAELRRIDHAEVQLEGLFGEKIFTMTYQEAEALGMVVPIMVDWLTVSSSVDPCDGLVSADAKEKHGIWRNQFRNEAIAAKARTFSAETQVLIMVSKIEHAAYLKKLLPEFRLCYAQKSGDDERYKYFVESGLIDPVDEPVMTMARRDQMREAFERGDLKKVIATDVWGTGVDFVGLQVLVRADGRSSPIIDTQLPGRVTRPNGAAKPYGIVVDCWDTWNKGALRKSMTRKRNYLDKGWTQVGLQRRRSGMQRNSV